MTRDLDPTVEVTHDLFDLTRLLSRGRDVTRSRQKQPITFCQEVLQKY